MKSLIAVISLAISIQVLSGCTTTDPQVRTTTTAPSIELKSDYQQALESMQTEQWQTAREQLTQITTRQPSLSGPWVNLGITQTMLGDHASAEAAFKAALDSNHQNIEAYNQLGMLYRRHGHLDKAQFIYEEALCLDPGNTNIHWNLAILYDRYLPNPRQALHHYQRYQQLTGSRDPQLLAWIAALGNHGEDMTARVKP